jgi:hypothetical protein
MTAVFADSFYWIALTNPRGAFHDTVLEFSRSLRPRAIVTTDEVLTELLTFSASDRQLRFEAGLVVNDVLADNNVRVVPQTRRSFLAGLTNDRHFEQEGFRALFRA